MKRLYLTSIVIILASILLSSCQTEKDYSSLSEAEGKKGMEAAEIYSAFLSISEDERVRWNYVYSLYEGEEYETALEEIDKGIVLYPDNIRFLYLKSLVYRKLGKIDHEISVLLTARDLNPGNIDIRKRLIELYDIIEDTENAKKEAKDILLYDGSNIIAIEYLSRESQFYSILYDSLKEKEESIKDKEETEMAEIEENMNE